MNDQIQAPASAREGGFTLIEVMVALAILALAVFPLLEVCNYSIADATITRQMRTARNLASMKLGEIRLGNPDILDGSSGDFTDQEKTPGEYLGFTWEVSMVTEGDSTTDPAEEGELGFEPPDATEAEELPYVLKRVEVLVRYPYIDDEREYRLETYIYLPQTEDDLEDSSSGDFR